MRINVNSEIGEIEGIEVAFLNRHGEDHKYAPHEIDYYGNIKIMKREGVEKIIATSSVGIINNEIKQGSIAIPDDFAMFDRITAYRSPFVQHVSLEEPYCPELRKILVDMLTNFCVCCRR